MCGFARSKAVAVAAAGWTRFVDTLKEEGVLSEKRTYRSDSRGNFSHRALAHRGPFAQNFTRMDHLRRFNWIFVRWRGHSFLLAALVRFSRFSAEVEMFLVLAIEFEG